MYFSARKDTGRYYEIMVRPLLWREQPCLIDRLIDITTFRAYANYNPTSV